MSSDAWTYEEFLCYLMIYAAAADHVIEEAEADVIKKKSGEATYEKMLVTYKNANDDQRNMLILAYKEQHFHSPDDSQKALNDLKEVYMADDDFSILEQNQLQMLEAVL